MVRLLVKNGAGLEMPTQEHRMPLMLAPDGEHMPVLQVLLWKGAKINAESGRAGITALSEAVETSENSCHHLMRVLQELGAPVDAVHTYSNTALKAAAHNGHLEAVRASKNIPKGRESPRWLRPSSINIGMSLSF
jgi:hypothetical protein